MNNDPNPTVIVVCYWKTSDECTEAAVFQCLLFMTQIKVRPYHRKLLLCNKDSIFTFASPLTSFNLLFWRKKAVTGHLNVCCVKLCHSKGRCVCFLMYLACCSFVTLCSVISFIFSFVLFKRRRSTADVVNIICRKFVSLNLYSTIKRWSIHLCDQCDDDIIYMKTMSAEK